MNKVVRFPHSVQHRAQSQTTDAEARALALDIRSSCIVEAPAGSGKTGLLVQRFLKLLAEGSVQQPEEVLAMTFTRKATAEMQQRVLDQLQAAHAGTPLIEDTAFLRETRSLAEAVLARSAQPGWDILAQPRRLNIRSILSVCVELTNSLPLLTGSGGAQQPVESPYPLYRLAARRTLLQLGGPDRSLDKALRTVLLHRDGSIANCEALIADMLHTREQWGELIPLGAEALDDSFLENAVRPKLEQTLADIVCGGLQRALDAIPPNVLEHLTHFAHRFADLPGYNGAPSPIALCAGKHLPPSVDAAHCDHWRALIGLVLKPNDGEWRISLAVSTFGFKPPKPELDAFKLFLASIQTDPLKAALAAVLNLPSPSYPEEQWVVVKSLFLVLRHALVELKLVFAERGECDFSEFALTARTALASQETASDDDATDLALSTGGKLRHLLVDEMQDTSTSQYELIKLLTRSWDGHSQTLFLVGDPKQSIYLFRQARVERFLRTMREQRLGDIPLLPLHLTANFRSQAALVDDFNDTFGGTDSADPIFPPLNHDSLRGSDAVDVPFIRAAAVRPQTQPAGIVWHPAVFGEEPLSPELKPTGIPAADHLAQEALEVRRIIEQRLAMPLPNGRSKPWQIAVLARARSHLSAIVQEFKAHNGKPEIPFRGIDLDPLRERHEVLDALALTRALLHPADRIAWLAVLHAPWCGLGLADLLSLTGEGPGSDPKATLASLIVLRRAHLSPQGRHLLDRAWPILEQAIAAIGRTPLSVHVERTWRSLGGDAALTPEEQSNVLRFLAALREVETLGNRVNPNLLADLTARLGNLYVEPRTGNIQVDLMTIHRAKGLEWDVVLIPGLHRKTRRAGSVLLNWLELDGVSTGDEASIVLAPIWGKGDDSDKLNDWLSGIRARRDRAEEKRLFYVASTRAREELHLFAAVGRKSNGDLTLPLNGSLLKACWPAAGPRFRQLVSQTVPALDDAALDGDPQDRRLALAAAASEAQPPLLHRLPLAFNPLARFTDAAAHALPYLPPFALKHSPTFDRPEGSFAVRAFGNVVHRYLQVLANRLAANTTPDELLLDLATWEPRLLASLRGEGLAPTLSQREASRALAALTRALADPAGRWILSPQPSAATERPLTFASPLAPTVRVDRTFLAAASPLLSGNTHLWIVDFKTTEQGSRSNAAFDLAERAKYSAQLESYAAAARALADESTPIVLALYYPLIPRLLHWLF